MSGTPEHPERKDRDGGEGDHDEQWELEPLEGSGGAATPAGKGSSKGKIEAGSLLDLAEESCPKCGAPMGHTDVVCTKCGYDMRANVQRTVETGGAGGAVEPEEKEDEAEDEEPFVTPGRGSPKVLAIAGAAVTVGAMVAAGVGVPPAASAWVVVAAVLLVAYEVIIHTGTGVVAVGVAARINEQRFGGERAVPLAAARVFFAMAVFELVLHLLGPLGWGGRLLAWPAAAGAYWVAVWALFNKTRTVALVIVLAQVILWVVIRLGMEIAAWQAGALRAAGAVGGAATGGG